MARTTRTTGKATTVAAPNKSFSFNDVEVGTVDVLPKSVVMKKENPLFDKVKDNVDKGPLYIPVPDGNTAWEAHNLIRRAAKDLNYGAQVRFTDADDNGLSPAQVQADYKGQVFVYFVVESERKAREYTERRYSNADIRKHFGLTEDAKISKEQRAEFREAKGFGRKSA